MMDSTPSERVYSLTDSILDFIVDIKFLKNVTVLHIFNVLTQLQSVVGPLLTRQQHLVTPYLFQCLLDTEAALLAVKKNLNEWSARSDSVLSIVRMLRSASSNSGSSTTSSSLKESLKEDRDLLIAKHVALQGAVQLVPQVRGYNIVTPPSSSTSSTTTRRQQIRLDKNNRSTQSLKMKMKMVDADQASIFEVDQYWKSHFGDSESSSSSAESEEFCDVLSLWLGEPLNQLAIKRLLLRLDESNSGNIAFSAFQGFVRQGNVRETVHLYTSDPPLPLLIWIDDDEFAIPRVVEATQQGITVVQLVSTAAVKSWVTINEEFLKTHNGTGKIRIIMNQVLIERRGVIVDRYNNGTVKSSNNKAGQQVTSFIRGKGIKLPILIYTSKQNLDMTKYVEDYDMVGSLSGNFLVFQAYLAALAGGRKDDVRWMRYNA